MRTSPRSRRILAGFTLAELMVATAIFVVGGSVVYPLFVGDFGLYVRNFSINKSNNSLRASLQQIKKDVDMAVQPPALCSFAMSGGTGVLTPLADSATSAQAMLMWVSLGPSYDMQPTGTGTTITPTGSITLKRHLADASDHSAESPLPQVGDRLVILSPAPSGPIPRETVTMGTGTITKPGRTITSVGSVSADSFTVTLSGTSTLPASIPAPQSVLIVREVAYAAHTITDNGGNAIERDLLYYPSTYNLGNQRVLTRDLDPNPKELDANSAVIQPFNYSSGKTNLSPLNVNLPIRALDYASAIADRNLNGAASGTSPSEFNVYLRSNPTMGIKVRLVN